MSRHIESQKGLIELLARYAKAGAEAEWIDTIHGCIKEGLAMDEDDYENSPKELRKLWKGLK